MKLQNKFVLVTGASKGIGRSIAEGMAAEGAFVLVNYNSDKASADETVARICKRGGEAASLKADISQPKEIFSMFQAIRKDFGRLDAVINNAGVTGWTNLFDITVEKWDAVIETNLRGTFFCSLEAAKIMKDNGGGSIVNVSTNCAELGVKNLVAYASSKGGIHAMTKQLAVELAPYGIRVNTFAPGPTSVDRNLSDDPNYEQTWGAMVPLARVASPKEMVGPAVFLASSDSAYMTGQVFFVDGGWTVSGRIPEAYFDQSSQKNA